MISKKRIKDLEKKFSLYENWLLSGQPDPMPTNIPLEYVKLSEQSPKAYVFYRQSMIKFVKELSGKFDIYNELKGLIDNLKRMDINNYQKIIDHFNSAELLEKTKYKWANVFDILSSFKSNEITHQGCFYYQQKYEIDIFLYFLTVIRKYLTKNDVDFTLAEFRDKNQSLRKGAMVNYIIADFKNYPRILNAVKSAYNHKLRNTIGHNNYKIQNGVLKSLDNTISVSRDEFFEACYFIQEIQNAIVWVMSNLYCQSIANSVKECGVASTFFSFDTKESVINLYQLWSFFNIDLEKKWLEKIIIKNIGNELQVNLTKNIYYKGEMTPEFSKWYELIKDAREINLIVTPIVPYTGDRKAKINLKWGEYQSNGENYECKLPVEIIE